MKIRSFLAFDIPEEIKAELGKLIELFAPKVKGVKWVKPELMHCTIRFFGDMDEEMLMGDLAKRIEKEVRHQSPLRRIVDGASSYEAVRAVAASGQDQSLGRGGSRPSPNASGFSRTSCLFMTDSKHERGHSRNVFLVFTERVRQLT